MARHGGLDLSGVNLYNENGGVVQGQICGQAIFTKLLRNKKGKGSMPLSQTPSVFGKDAGTLCMSPVGTGRPKKTKFRQRNEYVNMNMSTIDTESESCSSDDVFSEETSAGSLTATLDDLQSPAFVAQFDPMELLNPTPAQQEQQQQQPSPATRKSAPSWSASLPAVLEEDSKDSQSEQGSQGQGGIWRNMNSILAQPPALEAYDDDVEDDEEEEDSILRKLEQVFLMDSDRIESPRSIPNANGPPQRYLHEGATDDGIEQELESPGLRIPGVSKRRDHSKHSSKEQSMREAVDRRIQQVMDEEFGQRVAARPQPEPSVSEDESRDDSPRMQQHHQQERRQVLQQPDYNPFHQHHSSGPERGVQSNWYHQDESHALRPSAVSNQMQDLLRQQQVTLKEMSMQNYHYRKELSECQDMFGKWRMEREEQRSTINDLVKEKEAYASEANFLRNEMSSIRHELEALRKGAQVHTGLQNLRQKQEPLSEASSKRQELWSIGAESPFMQTRLPFDGQMQSPGFSEGNVALPTARSEFAPPPPPPPLSRPQPDTPTRLENHIGASKPDKPKPLVSKLKTTPTDPSKKKHGRSVTFHDPPKSKEWTLFPTNHVQDDEDILDSAFEAHQWTLVSQHQQQARVDNVATNRPEGLHVHPSNNNLEAVPEEEPPTPVAANGRVASSVADVESDEREAAANLYKYRLETIQRNRQQRVVGRADTVTVYGSPDGSIPGRQKKRRGRPAAT
ncbi:expressed unknown protein [Seminavis robusta]|uniref:Uncharacterized protein n=1 Tax=Seminavis robusta TaxID=568900 RepID=A0A9N8HX95_9STRA|nr:expressed unknown protein [Seminavis robusta]|eukprot:Sro1770_g296570.1 n/a (736) ;mRNA; f:13393-15600